MKQRPHTNSINILGGSSIRQPTPSDITVARSIDRTRTAFALECLSIIMVISYPSSPCLANRRARAAAFCLVSISVCTRPWEVTGNGDVISP